MWILRVINVAGLKDKFVITNNYVNCKHKQQSLDLILNK